eukprot:c4534_g1_i1.p1 GENE.c4534_g1_i1~~c4534_g1_i1.p1  ORF type:complete len:519 (+),score=103.47 c4534_g1_i1:692-2248(+)
MNCGFAVTIAPEAVESPGGMDLKRHLVVTAAPGMHRFALSRRKKLHSPSAFARKSHIDTVAQLGSEVWVWGDVEAYWPKDCLVNAETSVWCAKKPSVVPWLGRPGKNLGAKVLMCASCEVGCIAVTVAGAVLCVPFTPSRTAALAPAESIDSPTDASTTTTTATNDKSTKSLSEAEELERADLEALRDTWKLDAITDQLLGLNTDSGAKVEGETPTDVQAPPKAEILGPKKFLRNQVKEIACNSSVCIAVCENGLTFSWHWRNTPLRPLLLGRHATQADIHEPSPIPSVSSAASVACGEDHVMVLLGDMQVVMWGENRHGQLGQGDFEPRAYPERVLTFQPFRVVEVCCGAHHSIAVMLDGKVFACGRGKEGQLGLGTTEDVPTPQEVQVTDEEATVMAVSAGVRHTAYLDSRGMLFVSGVAFPGKQTVLPVQVKLPFWCVAVYCGPYHTLALCENPDGTGRDYSAYSWGEGRGGIMGLTDMEASNTPQLVKFMEGVQLVSASFGSPSMGMAVVVRPE